MTDPTNSPSAEAKAKQRFMTINAMRVAGVAMIMMGIAILNGVLDLPAFAAYVLIGLGLIETFVTPQVLARMWSTKNAVQDAERRDHDGRR